MYGQVGDGDGGHPPRAGAGAHGATAVAAGAHHSYALRQDGTVWAWGRNYRAELGDGTKIQRLRPVQVRAWSARPPSGAVATTAWRCSRTASS